MINKNDVEKLLKQTGIKVLPFVVIASGLILLLSMMLNIITNNFPRVGMVLTGIVAMLIFYISMVIRPGEEDFKSTMMLGLLYAIGIGIINLTDFNMTAYMIDFSNYNGFWLVLPWIFLISTWYLADAWALKILHRVGIKLP